MDVLRSLFGDEASILHEQDFQALMLVNTFPVMGSVLISPILDSLIGPWGTSTESIGLLVSVFSAPAIVMTLIAGYLADNYGRKRVLMASLILYGVAGASIALTTSFPAVLALRFLQGIAFGGIAPTIITSIGDVYEGAREATGQGIRFMQSGLVSTVVPLLAGLLVAVNWRYPFLMFGAALPGALVVYYWFDEPTDLADGDGSSGHERDVRRQLGDLSRLVRQRKAAAMIVARGLPMLVWVSFLTYNSIVVGRLQGGTPAQAGIVVAVGSVTYAAVASQAGRITSLFDSRLVPLVVANGCLVLGFVTFLLSPGLLSATFGITVVGVGIGLTLSLYRSILTGLTGEMLRGSLVSMAEAFGRFVVTLTPILYGAALALGTPVVGFRAAMQGTGIALAAVSGVGGIACLYVVASTSAIGDPS